MNTLRLLLIAFGLATASLIAAPAAHAQAEPAGIGPGSFISLGVTAAAYNSDYGHQRLGGPTWYLDANLYRRVGAEVEARTLRLNAQEQLRQTTLLAGPRLASHGRGRRPYIKLLAGRGTLDFPFTSARGSYFVVAPGAGFDLRLRGSRLQIRALDVEYQFWPKFTFGPMHPWGIATGVSYRLF